MMAKEGSPLIFARDLYKQVVDGAGTRPILTHVELQIDRGERVALFGASGSGKTTLLNILGGLDRDFRGEVVVAGLSLRAESDRTLARFRREALGFVFQSYNLLMHLTVLENVVLPARFGPARPDYERGREVLARVGLGDALRRSPRTLSGGERQRVAIARALYGRPRVVLCDEPTGNLDRQTAREVLSLFDAIGDEGTTLLIATHDEAVAEGAHRVLTLREGKIT